MKRLKQYCKKVTNFPIRLPIRPKTEPEDLFEELKATSEKPSARKYKQNSWVSDTTWALVDYPVQLKLRGGV